MRFQPEKCLYRFENEIILEITCWDGQFYLRRSKISEFWGLLLDFPLRNDPPLKIEILQYLDLVLVLEAEVLLKYVFLKPSYFYLILFHFYISYRPELKNFGICISNSTRLFLS